MSQAVPSFVVLGTQALLPITVGAFQSLRLPAPVRARRRAERRARRRLDGEDDLLDDEEEETLTLADSVLFPILGSATLLALWFLIKYVDKFWIDLAMGIYFSAAAVFAVQSTIAGILYFFFRVLGIQGPKYHLRLTAGIRQIAHLTFHRSSLLAAPLALALPALYVPLGRPYVLSNVLALCLGTAALAFLRLDGFPTAAALLGLLLAYDVFWVFYTPVMVTVAKGIDAPIKLVAPKDGGGYSMLGLGDVVVPGLLIALCLRLDLGRHAQRNPTRDVTPRSSFPKPYFATALGAYILGLAATVGAMMTTGKAQPALLYLSPACIAAPLLTATALGELNLLWTWRDVADEVEDTTIEAPSEVAMQARSAAKAKAVRDAAAQAKAAADADDDAKEADLASATKDDEDDSWMESTEQKDGPRTRSKRKGTKRK